MRLSIFLVTVILSLAASVRADTFTLTVNGDVETFTLPASPVISHSYDFGFAIAPVLVNEGGVEVVRQIDFFDAATGGGLLIESPDGPDFNGQGDTLYIGSNTQPTFLLGTFDLVGTDSGVLTISNSEAAPEPSSAVLLAMGLLGLFCLVRRKVNT